MEVGSVACARSKLLGKRKKVVGSSPNPLFVQWLSEWTDEAASKGTKMQYTYAKALKSLKRFPLPLASGKDCKILEFFGDKICKMLDDKLAKHLAEGGSLTPSSLDSDTYTKTKPKEKRLEKPVHHKPGTSRSGNHLSAPSTARSEDDLSTSLNIPPPPTNAAESLPTAKQVNGANGSLAIKLDAMKISETVDVERNHTWREKSKRFSKRKKFTSNAPGSGRRKKSSYRKKLLLNGEVDENTETIPTPIIEPTAAPLPNKQYTFIAFDLETTDRSRSANIIQLSAVCKEHELNKYILPRCAIQKDASAVHHLTVHRRVLLYKGIPVETVDLRSCLWDFIMFVKQFPNPLCFAHNGHNFDGPILCNELYRVGLLKEFTASVCGLTDTLKLFKSAHPKLPKHTQAHLVSHFFSNSGNYEAHNSLDDAKFLDRLVYTIDTSMDLKLKHSVSFDHIIKSLKYGNTKQLFSDTFKELVDQKLITQYVSSKMAGSGLNIHHLKLAYGQSGVKGVESVLTELVDGKPRVTKNTVIISKIVSFFDSGVS